MNYTKFYCNPPAIIENLKFDETKLAKSIKGSNFCLVNKESWTALVLLYGADAEIVIENSKILKKPLSLWKLDDRILNMIQEIKKKKEKYYKS